MLQTFSQWPSRPVKPLPEGLMVERAEDLRKTGSKTPVHSVDDSGLAFSFGEGGVSRASYRTQPDMVWIASCKVSLIRQGELLPCKFGPVFLDRDEKIVKWWRTLKVSFDDANYLELSIPSTSPPEAAWVKLGVLGPWAEAGHTTAAYKFSDCLLARAGSEAPR